MIYVGKDPRDDPESYIRWFCGEMNISDAREEITLDLERVVGDLYDEERVRPLLERLGKGLDVEEFIKQVMQGQVMEPGMFSLILKARSIG
jgi:hypothetical protein